MTSDRLDLYFAHEAMDYLDQIEVLLSEGGRPDMDQLLRLSRGVRGSAQMAGAASVAAVAERLEEGVRSVQGNQVVWSEEIRQISLQTAGDLKLLVRASSRWGEREENRVRSAIQRWDEVEPTADDADQERRQAGADDAEPVPPGETAPAGTATEVDIATLFFDDEGPHVLTPDPEEEMNLPATAATSEPVPIEALLLDRGTALREALALRDELERAMRGVPGADVELAGIVRELFELLEVAAEGVASGG